MTWFYKHKFLLRLTVVYVIHILIKGFDYSFGSFFNFTVRGVLFGFFFILFWLGIWYFSEFLNKKLSGIKYSGRFLINVVFGYCMAFLTNWGYRMGDIAFYDNSELWQDISLFNPEFTIALSLIYLLIFSISEYMESQFQISEKKLRTARLEKENTMAQYMSLKAQIEPHFLFNSLSVLSSIVHTDAELASEFIVKLSKTLRYIIEKNEFVLVCLDEELGVINDYFYLLKTRLGNGVRLHINIDDHSRKNIYVPPAAIQLLVENAVKHNKKSDDNPLVIEIFLDSRYIVIRNKLNKIQPDRKSTSVGLSNIKQRYRLLSGSDVMVTESDKYFEVKLPVLNQSDYENFNN